MLCCSRPTQACLNHNNFGKYCTVVRLVGTHNVYKKSIYEQSQLHNI